MANLSIAVLLFLSALAADAQEFSLTSIDTTTATDTTALPTVTGEFSILPLDSTSTTVSTASPTGGDDAVLSQVSKLASICTDLTDSATASMFVSCAASVSSAVDSGCNTGSTDCGCVMTQSVLVACLGSVCDDETAGALTSGLGACSGAAPTGTGSTTSSAISNLDGSVLTTTTSSSKTSTADGETTTAADGENVESTGTSSDFAAMITPVFGAMVAGVMGVVGAFL